MRVLVEDLNLVEHPVRSLGGERQIAIRAQLRDALEKGHAPFSLTYMLLGVFARAGTACFFADHARRAERYADVYAGLAAHADKTQMVLSESTSKTGIAAVIKSLLYREREEGASTSRHKQTVFVISGIVGGSADRGDCDASRNYSAACIDNALKNGFAPIHPAFVLVHNGVIKTSNAKEEKLLSDTCKAWIDAVDAVHVYVDNGLTDMDDALIDYARSKGKVVEFMQHPTYEPDYSNGGPKTQRVISQLMRDRRGGPKGP